MTFSRACMGFALCLLLVDAIAIAIGVQMGMKYPFLAAALANFVMLLAVHGYYLLIKPHLKG